MSDQSAPLKWERDIRCPRCNGSGEIACSIYYPCIYIAPGPVPEHARHVYSAKCDWCSGSGEMTMTME